MEEGWREQRRRNVLRKRSRNIQICLSLSLCRSRSLLHPLADALCLHQRRDKSNRAELVFGIEERRVALGGGIKLCDLRHFETVLKRAPYLRPHAVPNGHAHIVGAVVLGLRRVDEVPAEFPNVLYDRRLVLRAVFPKVRRAELLPHHQCRAELDGGADANERGGGVVERKGTVDDLGKRRNTSG